LKSDPTLASILGIGGNVISTIGPANDPLPFNGKQFPTFFRIVKEPKNGLTKYCPLNRTVRVEFETDAANGYFERPNCPGSIIFDPPNLCVTSHLWDGKFTGKFQLPYDAQVGDKINLQVTVSDIERETKGQPFVSQFMMVGVNEAEDVPPPGHRYSGKKPSGNGKHSAPVYAALDIREVRRANWEDPAFKFNEYSALKVVNADEENGFVFFVNMDNQFLIHELHKANDQEGSLIRHWFKYGVVLSALGILKELQRLQQEAGKNNDDNGEEELDLQRIGKFCAGLARVVVPMIRALYKGPTLLASEAVAVLS